MTRFAWAIELPRISASGIGFKPHLAASVLPLPYSLGGKGEILRTVVASRLLEPRLRDPRWVAECDELRDC